MPEEKNRVLCDVLADDLFCPTEVQRRILIGEGVEERRIHVTGNTIVDAVLQSRELASRSTILERLDLTPKDYILLTAHRASVTDERASLERLLSLITQLRTLTGQQVVYPLHPRTGAKLQEFGLEITDALVTEPVGYRDFLALEMNAAMIVTDSGGVQEEACILRVPCITIRENTERPETVDVGANRLIGLDTTKLREALDHHAAQQARWDNPFGDGKAAERIVEVICQP
jgi:UDP-N-acetylglucosamine 2-epimerase (non-hydrolysing)